MRQVEQMSRVQDGHELWREEERKCRLIVENWCCSQRTRDEAPYAEQRILGRDPPAREDKERGSLGVLKGSTSCDATYVNQSGYGSCV